MARGSQGGRPAHEPTDATRQIVTVLWANGISQDYICIELKITLKTLRKHYRDELEFAKERVRAQIGANVIKKALGLNGKPPDNACMFFWLKTQGGWVEARPPRLEDDDDDRGSGNAPPPIVIRVSGGFRKQE